LKEVKFVEKWGEIGDELHLVWNGGMSVVVDEKLHQIWEVENGR